MIKSEIRKDYFKDQYVIIAPNRAKRPQTLIKKESTDETNVGCGFCPQYFTNKVVTYRDNEPDGNWLILSTVNAFPAVSLDNPDAYGQAEVIIETNKHAVDINEFSVDHIVRVFDAYISRYTALKNVENIKYVIIYKNEGGKAGASLSHSHSQIYALPLVPPKVQAEVVAYDKYVSETGNCPYCDIIAKESGSSRVIWEDRNLFVLAPYASESPYGAWFIPKRHVSQITDLSENEKESFAKAMKVVLGKLDQMEISYNYFVENSVNDKDYHMHIKLAPRPNIWAGLELGTGIIINHVPPEMAAGVYRGEE